MTKEAQSQDAKKGNQILELILGLNKLLQVNTKMLTQSNIDAGDPHIQKRQDHPVNKMHTMGHEDPSTS